MYFSREVGRRGGQSYGGGFPSDDALVDSDHVKKLFGSPTDHILRNCNDGRWFESNVGKHLNSFTTMADSLDLSSVKSYLRQLKQPELVRLAKNKGANVSEKMEKPDLVKILTPFVSQRDVVEMFRKPGETGIKGVLSGEHFERKALSLFKRMGFSCHLDQRIKGSEFDIVGDREIEGFFSNSKEWLLAECKNKPKVLLNDFMKFAGKFETFKRRHSEDKVQGFFITSGVFDPTVKSAKRSHPEIQLKRIRA